MRLSLTMIIIVPCFGSCFSWSWTRRGFPLDPCNNWSHNANVLPADPGHSSPVSPISSTTRNWHWYYLFVYWWSTWRHAVGVGYLCNVLTALEVNPSIHLKQVVVLLKAHPEQSVALLSVACWESYYSCCLYHRYETTAKNENIPNHSYTRVAEIRGIDI